MDLWQRLAHLFSQLTVQLTEAEHDASCESYAGTGVTAVEFLRMAGQFRNGANELVAPESILRCDNTIAGLTVIAIRSVVIGNLLSFGFDRALLDRKQLVPQPSKRPCFYLRALLDGIPPISWTHLLRSGLGEKRFQLPLGGGLVAEGGVQARAVVEALDVREEGA